jgi:hypothetical protein
MIVPKYWAEGRARERKGSRQFTVRRFGWSDESQAAAQAHADARTAEALARVIAGVEFERREPKIPYNGAEGMPIREEIVSRHGDCVITRNSYGAKCLNTPNVFFADIDFGSHFEIGGCATALAVFAGVAAIPALFIFPRFRTIILLVPALLILAAFAMKQAFKASRRRRGGEEQIALDRVRQFVERHPEWNVRLYRTPAGLRVLAMHKTFDPNDPEVAEAFEELGVDSMYAFMCQRQRCFRARVSPKPWRIGIEQHLRPRPGVWPVAPERMAARTAWIENYDEQSKAYASCAYLESLGSGRVDAEAKFVQELHDSLAQSTSSLPIA